MMKKSRPTRGGKRVNSGRKKLPEIKEPVTIYIYPSVIKKNGGRDKTRAKLLEVLQK